MREVTPAVGEEGVVDAAVDDRRGRLERPLRIGRLDLEGAVDDERVGLRLGGPGGGAQEGGRRGDERGADGQPRPLTDAKSHESLLASGIWPFARTLRAGGKAESRERVADLLADPTPRVEARRTGSGRPSAAARTPEVEHCGLLPARPRDPRSGSSPSEVRPSPPRASQDSPATGLADEGDDRPAFHRQARAGDGTNRGEPSALVVDDDVGEVERAHRVGSDAERVDRDASARPFTATSGGTASLQDGCAYPYARMERAPGRKRYDGVGGTPCADRDEARRRGFRGGNASSRPRVYGCRG